MKISEVLKKFPNFQSWMDSKKLNQKDIDILTEFPDSKIIEPVLNWISKNQPSHSQGQQILELSGELLLMKKSINPILETEQDSKKLITLLKKLRYPVSSNQDDKNSSIVNSLPWPSSIKARWVRQNDQGSLEISFKSNSLNEFDQKIKSLEKMKKSLESLWSKKH